MSKQKQSLEEQYEEIMKLYDIADALADTVESRFVTNQEAQLKIVEPLIEQLGNAADELTTEFISLAEGKKKLATRNKVEGALRKIYVALEEYTRQVHGASRVTGRKIKNVADSIVEKLRAEVENLVVIFLDLVEISIERIMHKKDVEELKRRRTDVTFQLHQMAQQH
jgi:uncharacterized alkaline shock family protein YloU